MLDTDWSDRLSHITPNFTVYEACWLPSVSCLYFPTYEERQNLTRLCKTMEKIRALVGKPINVHCQIRPKWYNALPGINGSEKSYHILGMACDFRVVGMNCDVVRELLRKNADVLDICIEDRPGSAWVHIDTGLPRAHGGRFFKP